MGPPNSESDPKELTSSGKELRDPERTLTESGSAPQRGEGMPGPRLLWDPRVGPLAAGGHRGSVGSHSAVGAVGVDSGGSKMAEGVGGKMADGGVS